MRKRWAQSQTTIDHIRDDHIRESVCIFQVNKRLKHGRLNLMDPKISQ